MGQKDIQAFPRWPYRNTPRHKVIEGVASLYFIPETLINLNLILSLVPASRTSYAGDIFAKFKQDYTGYHFCEKDVQSYQIVQRIGHLVSDRLGFFFFQFCCMIETQSCQTVQSTWISVSP